jgi:hypothetical protein
MFAMLKRKVRFGYKGLSLSNACTTQPEHVTPCTPVWKYWFKFQSNMTVVFSNKPIHHSNSYLLTICDYHLMFNAVKLGTGLESCSLYQSTQISVYERARKLSIMVSLPQFSLTLSLPRLFCDFTC